MIKFLMIYDVKGKRLVHNPVTPNLRRNCSHVLSHVFSRDSRVFSRDSCCVFSQDSRVFSREFTRVRTAGKMYMKSRLNCVLMTKDFDPEKVVKVEKEEVKEGEESESDID